MATDGITESRLTIAQFSGIDQSRGDYNSDLTTSPDALNFVARYGFIRTHRGVSTYLSALPTGCERIYQVFFHGTGDTDTTRLVASGGGKLYALVSSTWAQIGTGFTSNAWQVVNYKHDEDDWAIFVNGVDSAQYWDGGSAVTALALTQGGESIIFSQLTLLYERLWGAVRASIPDRVYWSESFAPADWDLDYDTPDAGGGFVDVATFDGTRIRAIVAAFDDILIFKDKSMHRLNGTYPGEFNLTQVYGSEGTLAPRSIVHTADKLYFLGPDGLCLYDGMTVASLASQGDRKLQDVWARLNTDAISVACACIYDGVLYCAVPLDTSTTSSHVVEYSLSEGTYSLIGCSGIQDFVVYRSGQDEKLLCLIGNQLYLYDSGTAFATGAINASWETPEIDAGSLSSKKTTGRIYMSVTASSIDVGANPEIKLTLTSGGKTRTRTVELTSGVNIIRKRLKIRGRSFKLKIENVDGNPLTINRGVEISLEVDQE